ncbi:PREDICTED: uncharacterized protein LOC106814375 [Priapulus caudatus]|uniref:Uncharacterized protein LOC106814375 n=1 Tax=Priapulus caudatus TaxID=37621 RepID=A0ABM1EPQ0_PRICU|nr:PREDICTED: uncharacterized protein LOC106814375 [Priapulus caudatus]
METTSTTYYRCLACGECFFTESSFARHSRTVHCKVLVCRGHDAEPSGETFLRHALSLAAVKMEPPDDVAEDRPCASAPAPARDVAYGVHATDDGSDAISSDPVVVTTDDGVAACAGPVAADDDKGMIALEECGFLAADLRAGAPLPAAASRLEDFLSGIAPASRDERGNPARGRDDACKRRRHETHDNNGGGGGGGGGGDLARGRPPQAGLGMDGGALSVHAREDATWDRVAADDGAGAGGRLDYEHVESLLRDELPLSSIGGWPQLAPEWPPDEPPPPPPRAAARTRDGRDAAAAARLRTFDNAASSRNPRRSTTADPAPCRSPRSRTTLARSTQWRRQAASRRQTDDGSCRRPTFPVMQ